MFLSCKVLDCGIFSCPSDDSSSSDPAIGAGIGVGIAVVGIAAVAVVVILFLRRKKKRPLPPIPGMLIKASSLQDDSVCVDTLLSCRWCRMLGIMGQV